LEVVGKDQKTQSEGQGNKIKKSSIRKAGTSVWQDLFHLMFKHPVHPEETDHQNNDQTSSDES